MGFRCVGWRTCSGYLRFRYIRLMAHSPPIQVLWILALWILAIDGALAAYTGDLWLTLTVISSRCMPIHYIVSVGQLTSSCRKNLMLPSSSGPSSSSLSALASCRISLSYDRRPQYCNWLEDQPHISEFPLEQFEQAPKTRRQSK